MLVRLLWVLKQAWKGRLSGHACSLQEVGAGWLPCDPQQGLSLAGDTGRFLPFRPWTVLFWILLPSQGKAPC